MPLSADAASSGAGPASLRAFRIFLASPGDVAHERMIVREVLDQLRMERRFRDRLALQLIAWDQPGAAVAMPAGITPQEAIARGLPLPADCDLTVVVFWSRMGTLLPPEYTKPDGSRFLSGTEWEYCNAMDGFRAKGRPEVWLFHRHPAPKIDLDDPHLDEAREQQRQVGAFFRAVRNPDGSIGGGVNFYSAPDDFRRQFEQLLRDHLETVVSKLDAAAEADPHPDPHPDAAAAGSDDAEPGQGAGVPRYEGDPYPGLAAFTPEQAPVFFGRGAEIDQLLTVLADPAVRFVAVVGLSGSGKSSLVAAGLIPRLRDGLIGGAPWRDLRFTPAERGPNPFLALAAAVKEALPADADIGAITVADLAADLRTEPGRVAHLTQRLLNGRPNGAELLLYVDQFEELFTQADAALVAPFVDLIAAAAETPRVRVVATMRADFYAAAIEQQGLAALLRRDRGSFPLDPPGVAALTAIIERPARAAGLDLEDGLVEQIVKDAFGSPGSGDGPGGGPGTLALTAFALRELYEQRRQSDNGGEPLAPGTCLTLDDYEAIGRIEGAVRRRADDTLKRAGQPADRVLDDLFGHLVEVNEQEVATRRRAAKDALPAPARPLADALTTARLLTAGRGADDRPTVELAHETLLRAWPRLADWVRDHADALRARRDLERAATEWQASKRSGDALRGGAVLKRYRNAPGPRTPLAGRYLAACGRRLWRNRVLGAAGIAVLVAGLAVWNHINNPSGYHPTLVLKGLLIELGLGRLPGPLRLLKDPDMVLIEGDTLRDGRRGRRRLLRRRAAGASATGCRLLDRPLRGHLRRIRPVRRGHGPGAPERREVGARQAAGHQRLLGGCQSPTPNGSPDIPVNPIGCRARRNGNTPPAAAPRPRAGSRRPRTPTPSLAGSSTGRTEPSTSRPTSPIRQSRCWLPKTHGSLSIVPTVTSTRPLWTPTALRRILMAYIISSAMSGNGSPTVGMTTAMPLRVPLLSTRAEKTS